MEQDLLKVSCVNSLDGYAVRPDASVEPNQPIGHPNCRANKFLANFSFCLVPIGTPCGFKFFACGKVLCTHPLHAKIVAQTVSADTPQAATVPAKQALESAF